MMVKQKRFILFCKRKCLKITGIKRYAIEIKIIVGIMKFYEKNLFEENTNSSLLNPKKETLI